MEEEYRENDRGGGENSTPAADVLTKKLSFIQADELIKMKLEKTMFIVEGLIPTGLSIVASPPKYGKSWFVLDMCVSVAAGSEFLGHDTNQCGVLYLALEDSASRLRDRLEKVLNGRKAPPGFAMCTEAGDLGHGLINQLAGFVEERPETRLIVIDTFEKIRSDIRRGESAYAFDYRESGEIKRFADQNKVAVVLVHHSRKAKDYSDAFTNISGTNGLTGSADTMMIMEKEDRTDENTKLSITGRDVEMNEYQMAFRGYRWHIEGTAEEIAEKKREEEYNQSPIIRTIKKLLEQNKDGWTGTASELINASKYFRTPIYENVQRVGRKINDLSEALFRMDNIIFEAIKNGNGSKRYRFYYGETPFD